MSSKTAAITYVQAKPQDLEEVLDFMMENYFPYETLCAGLGVTPSEEWRNFHKGAMEEQIKSSVSLLARDKSNGGNALAGVTLGLIVDDEEMKQKMKQDEEQAEAKSEEMPQFKDPMINRMIECVNEARKGFDHEAAFKDSGKMMWINFLCVAPKYQRLGIAQKLTTLSVDEARKEKCNMVGVSAAGIKSQKLFEKMGFRVVHKFTYADIKDAKGQVYVKPKDGTVYHVLYDMKL